MRKRYKFGMNKWWKKKNPIKFRWCIMLTDEDKDKIIEMRKKSIVMKKFMINWGFQKIR